MRIKPPFSSSLYLLAWFAGIVSSPIASEAQTIRSPYQFIEGRHTVGLVGGPFSMDRGELRLGPGNGTAIGLLYGIEVRGPLALEAGVLAIRANREVYQATAQRTVEYLGDVTSTLVGAEARLRFSLTGARTWNHLTPYLFAGGGMIGATGGRTDLEADLNPTQLLDLRRRGVWSFGGGTRWYPSEKLSIRAEGTFRTWVIKVPSAYSLVTLPGGGSPLSEQRVGGLSLTLGASYGL